MEIVSVVASMAQCLCGQCCSNVLISEQCSHLRTPQAQVANLQREIKRLIAREADLRRKLQEEVLRRGGEPTAELEHWLESVQEMKFVQARLEEEIKKSRLCGCFPNYYRRLKLGNYVTRKTHEVDKLLEQHNIFSGSSLVNMLPKRGKTLPTTALVGETTKIVLKETWEHIMDMDVGIIGVYGMGGVGKTAVVKEINNKLLTENAHFDVVVWVTASKDSNVQILQRDIAKEIGLSFNAEDSEITRASNLLEALQRRGRFLLIIDDLWEEISLENIGIPIPTNTNGCKLLITTRSLSVCGMETTKETEVRVLSDNEAWYLFKQKVGEEVMSSPRLLDLAQRVAKECGGLPLALIAVGRAMRKEGNIKQWQIALNELRNSTKGIQGMQNQVFARLRFSYERLKNDMTRECFLYCALYPEDYLIEVDELIKYWAWEGLLGSFGCHTVKMQLGDMILNELKSACMLESVYQDGSSDEYVKMHDLIRDMAIELTRANSTFMVKSGRGLQVPPVEDEWHPDLERVSLMRNDLSSLNREPRCPKLCTLLLNNNSISKGIYPCFFEHMDNLKVLDLSFTGINKLPESLSNLESLHTLILQHCWELSYVPTLEKLKELRVLDISYTSIEHMPEGMDMLFNLQYLDMSFTKGFEVPYHLLWRYRFLECLFLISPWQFGLDPAYAGDILAMCSRLVVLQLNFSNMETLKYDYMSSSYFWRLLDNFCFFIGRVPLSVHTGKNCVGFFGVDLSESSNLIWWLKKTLELEICECPSITHLPLFITSASYQLQRCKIKGCDRMEFIFMSESSTFSKLEWLEIEGLINLRRLYKGILTEGTFASLKTLDVRSCNNLKTLLPLELVQNLKNLVELRIEECDKIEEVMSTREENGEIKQVHHPDTILPNLRIVKLNSLPQLKHISRGIMICDSLSSLEVLMCPLLKTLPFLVEINGDLVDSVKQIKGSRRWWETIRRNHSYATHLLDPVFKDVPELSATEDDSIISHGSGSSSFGPR